jgi:hypothetical protein
MDGPPASARELAIDQYQSLDAARQSTERFLHINSIAILWRTRLPKSIRRERGDSSNANKPRVAIKRLIASLPADTPRASGRRCA